MNPNYVHRVLVGNGAAENIELGFVPEFVMVINATDGDDIRTWSRSQIIPFTSGGTKEIAAGDTITGATSGATAIVRQVLLSSGSWAGGDAAGVLVVNEDQITGTFGSENVYVSSDTTSGINDATVTANVEHTQKTTTAVAAATSTDVITSYLGSAGSASKGITLGAGVMEEAKVLHLHAWRG